MREQCEHEQQACTALQGSQKPHKLLTQGEESLFGDLDERIEALDAEAEFMALSIAEHDREIQEGLNTKYASTSNLRLAKGDSLM
jgi:DNA replication initiation complex subunit (GINS family)